MGDVVYLRPQDKKDPAPNTNGYYYCMNCHRDHFKIYEDGAVRCANCDKTIKNLFVKLENAASDPQ